jgi:uncharacterized protein
MASLVAFLSGLVFALGLGLSGMTQPAKVLGFLDVAGRWDPSLAFVMVGAIGVHAALSRMILRRRAPMVAPSFSLPVRRKVDARLLIGAAVFGVGWGLAGLCPGPAVTVVASGKPIAVAFVGAMLLGMVLADRGEHTSPVAHVTTAWKSAAEK